MKHISIWFQTLSRSKQIGICVLVAHVAVILMLALNHVTARRLKPKQAIAIRTLLAPQSLTKKESITAMPAKKETAQNLSQNKPAAHEKPVAIEKKGQAGARKEVKKIAPEPRAPKQGASPISSLGKTTSKNEKGIVGGGIDNELLQQIAKSLEAIAAPTKASRTSNFAVALPPSIEIQTGTHHSFDSPDYGQMVSAILQNSLDLPEFGQVVAKIEIDASGAVTQCEILETRSQKNATFLKKRLQELAFPCFNEFGLTEARLNFTITFRNVETH